MTLQPPNFMQNLGTTAKQDRGVLLDTLQAGVIGSGDLKVSAGGGLVAQVAAGVGYVRGTTNAMQGLYRCWNDALVNLNVATNSGGVNPRIDSIIARVYDSTEVGSGPDQWTLEVLTGAAAAGATLDNRSGAPALPASCILLADILMAAGATTVVSGNIRDRRPWARGAMLNVEATGATNTGVGSYTQIFGLVGGFESSGAPCIVQISGGIQGATVNAEAYLGLFIDGVDQFDTLAYIPRTGGVPYQFSGHRTVVPAAGHRVVDLRLASSSGSVTTYGPGLNVARFTLREQLVGAYTSMGI